ncbi:MAG TPA: MBL fold metallo-hydrolase [Treponemataceae bacterium]|nr:MBL fold metallo-hydrolase [Treponemataceae bacterium]
MIITILADNRFCNRGGSANKNQDLLTEHGFSCLLETNDGQTMLFDLGQKVFIHNAEVLGKNLKELDALILSHGHYDHSDGLSAFFTENTKTKLFASKHIFTDHFSKKTGTARFIGLNEKNKNIIEKLPKTQKILFSKQSLVCKYKSGTNKHRIEVHGAIKQKHPLEKPSPLLFADADCTESDTMLDETILAIETDKGLFLITGCGHAGFINICETIRKRTRKKILAVLGGFHLEGVSKERLKATRDYIKKTGIEKIYPCHCTGDTEIEWLEKELPGIAQKVCVGDLIKLDSFEEN